MDRAGAQRRLADHRLRRDAVIGRVRARPPCRSTPRPPPRRSPGLTNGTTYTFNVAAINAVGTGPVRAVERRRRRSSAGRADDRHRVRRQRPRRPCRGPRRPPNGGSPITGYVVTPYIGVVAADVVHVQLDGHHPDVTGLTNGTTYTFKVAAMNAVGTGPHRPRRRTP